MPLRSSDAARRLGVPTAIFRSTMLDLGMLRHRRGGLVTLSAIGQKYGRHQHPHRTLVLTRPKQPFVLWRIRAIEHFKTDPVFQAALKGRAEMGARGDVESHW